jgi:hypothetical protein
MTVLHTPGQTSDHLCVARSDGIVSPPGDVTSLFVEAYLRRFTPNKCIGCAGALETCSYLGRRSLSLSW